MRTRMLRIGIACCMAVGLAYARPAVADANEKHEAGGHEMAHAHAGDPTLAIAVSPGTLTPGKKSAMTLTISDAGGKPVTLDNLKEVHTKKIHLLAVDPSLIDYQHIHPVAGDKPGSYTFDFSPQKSGEYKVFADLVPTATGEQEYVATLVQVSGKPETVEENVNDKVTVGGLDFAISFEKSDLLAGEANLMTLTATGADGKPFTQLEPLMGAFAHLVAFDKTRTEIAHVHPMGKEPEAADERGGPSLEFHLKFSEPGYQKLFAQFQIDGKDVYVPFGLQVKPGMDDGHGDTHAHGEEHGAHGGKMDIPDSAAALMAEVDEHLNQLDNVVASGKLDQVHELAFAVRDMLAALPERLHEPPQDVSITLNSSLGKIRQQAELLDKYGDAGNAAQTKAVLGKFKAAVDGIGKLIALHIGAKN